MSKITLQECNSISIDDLFMATIVERMPEEAWRQLFETEDEMGELLSELKETIDAQTKQFGTASSLYEQGLEELMALVTISPYYAQSTVLLKKGDRYVELSIGGKEIDQEKQSIEALEPLSKYYSKEEYHFEEVEGKMCIALHSREPLEEYEKQAMQQLK